MNIRTAGLPLCAALTASALALSACATEPEEQPAPEVAESTTDAPAETSAESPEESPAESPAPSPAPAPAPSADGSMSPEEFNEGGSTLAGQSMQDWLIAEGEPLPEDAQNLLYEITDQVIHDPSVTWLDEGREHAGATSELVPIAYPGFDSYTPNFRSDELGQHFQAVALRIDQSSMMDFITGLSYVTDLENSPSTPGLMMSGNDDQYFYLVALLDLTQVDRDGEINDWRTDYVSEIFRPFDVWRTSVQQGS